MDTNKHRPNKGDGTETNEYDELVTGIANADKKNKKKIAERDQLNSQGEKAKLHN